MKFVDNDFRDLLQFLKTNLNITLNKEKEACLKKIHKNIFSICVLESELSKEGNINNFFLSEVRSDAIKILPLISMGFQKPIFLLTRSMVENVFKHIFYEDHPIEYNLLEVELKDRPTFEDLFIYLSKHPLFRENRKIQDTLSKIKNEYANLSRYIHTSNKEFASSKKFLSELKINDNKMKKYSNLLSGLVNNLLLILLIFHKKDLPKVNSEYKKFLLINLSKSNKRIFHNIK